MVCIIRSKYQNELKQLSGILGGEKAAHYALCMNNGYNLTDTKEGKHSKLFDQLKEKYGEDEAIRMKTYIFTPQFTDQFGDWYNQAVENTDENGEPEVQFVEKFYNKQQQKDSQKSIMMSTFGIESKLDQMKESLSWDEGEAIDAAIQNSLQIEDQKTTINPGEPLIHFFKRKNINRANFINSRVNQIMQKRQQVLAQHYGLKQVVKDDGSIEYSTDSKDVDKQILVKFVNSLGDKRGMYREAEHTLYISLINADPTTMNHELAHYYVRTFWQSKEVQKALSIFDDKKLSSRQLEERLVEEITSRTMAENFSTEPQKRSIIQQFWNSFKSLLNRLILGKMTESKKNDILDSIAANFYLNKQLEQDYKSMAFYDKYNGDMFQQGDIPNANDLKVYETISTAVKRRYSAERAQKAKDTIKIQTLRAKIKEYQEDIDLGFFGEHVTRSTDEQQEK